MVNNWHKLITELRPPSIITLIGGGGKTSLMYYLLKVFKGKGLNAVAVCTTKLANQVNSGHIYVEVHDIQTACKVLNDMRHMPEYLTLISSEDEKNSKFIGIPAVWVDILAAKYPDTIFIVEGDGAAGKSIKGHLNYEPVIPYCSNMVIAIIGVDCLGKAINEKNVHRPNRIFELTGANNETKITADIIVQLLFHQQGYLHNCPSNRKVLIFINKVETSSLQQQAVNVAKKILELNHSSIGGVVLGSVKQGRFALVNKNILEANQ